jgi:tRNA dimethylallyltransferase
MKYIIVCGPTCSGKTSLGVKLALRFNGEIIGADSRQIYKHADIGTAKPESRELRGIKYHLIDFLELHEDFSAYKFAELAKTLLVQIFEQRKTPIVVGGTGLYLKALTEGLFKSPEPDIAYRRELENIGRKSGSGKLHEMLSEIDPEAAGRPGSADQSA